MRRMLRFAAPLSVLAALLASPATAVGNPNPYYLESRWEFDPLFSGKPRPCAPDATQCTGYWWRDTTNQNALSQHTVDEFTDEIVTVYHDPVTDFAVHVYLTRRMSNVVVLTTPADYFVIGTGGSADEAAYVRSMFARTVPRFAMKVLRGVVLPDASEGSTFGVHAWTGFHPVAVYASQSYEAVIQQRLLVSQARASRRGDVHGWNLPWGPDGMLGIGSGKEDPMATGSPPQPTTLISAPTDIYLAGHKIRLVPTTRLDAGLVIQLPDEGIVIAGMGKFFPELNALLGPSIPALEWIGILDELRQFSPSVLVPLRGWPVVGASSAIAALLAQRDALQYVHDETVRRSNDGAPLDEIVATLRLPDSLATHPWVQEFATIVPFVVRSTYEEYMGWFAGNPVDLATTLTELARAEALVQVAGGAVELVTAARKAELAAQSQADAEKALFLARAAYVYTFAKGSSSAPEAKAVYAQALKKNALMQKSAHVRNYYLMEAMDLP